MNGRGCRIRWILVALLASLPLGLHAERLPIKTYTTADGLAHNEINKIVRDSRGFLWFATNDGLSRFDGYAFSNYSVGQGLPHPTVRDFLETKSGELWVATFGGLVRFHPEGVPRDHAVQANDVGVTTPMFATIAPADEDPRARSILVLFESRDGTIWCGTRKGLFRLERSGHRLELRPVDLGLAQQYLEQKHINDLEEDEHGSLWAATPSGLYRRWRDGSVARYSFSGVLPYDHLHDLMKDHEGHIWVATRYNGFFRIGADGSHNPPVIVEHHGYPHQSASWVFRLLETSDHRFWVGSNLGVVEFLRGASEHGSRFIPYNRRHGLVQQEITALAEDAGGNLWMGTSSGAMKLARNGFVSYGRLDGVGGAMKVLEDGTGDLYVLAHVFRNGLPGDVVSTSLADEHVQLQFGRFDGRGFEWFMPGPPYWWASVPQGSTMQTRNGEWWLAGGSGLFRYPSQPRLISLRNAKPIRVFDKTDGLPGLQVYHMFEDSRGDVWFSIFSSRNGLFRWNRKTDSLTDMAAVQGFPSVQDELPRSFGEDRDGNIWIGLNTGVARYRNGQFAFYTSADGLSTGSIGQIYLGAGGRLWLASSRSGLIRIDDPAADRPEFRRYTTAQGLSGNRIEVITEDLYGRIYVATGRGVDQLEPATELVKYFTTEDGLAPGGTLGAFRDRSGALWFGTYTGLSRFRPEAPKTSPAPAILITGVTVAGTPRLVSAIGETQITLADLAPDRNQLQIEFASLPFAAGERLRYQFRLDGADSDWRPPTAGRSVSFASLAPGSYRFLVRAVNADGAASPQPAVIGFTVLRPFWLRWWFLMLAATGLAAAAVAFHRYRLSRILELERVRARIATDLHDDVGANLTRIALLSEAAKQREGNVTLASIARIARESVSSMSDIVWSVNPKRESLNDLVRRMRQHADEVFTQRGIELRFNAPGAADNVKLGMEVRRDLLLVFKEIVNNAVRHSRCSAVAIDLVLHRARIVLRIADNGVGFDTSADHEGQGMTSLRRRAAALKGSIDVVSAGAGTTVTLDVPL